MRASSEHPLNRSSGERHSEDRNVTERMSSSSFSFEEIHPHEGDVSKRSRILALIAVCTLSIGSHFSMYLLGPLKSRLHQELGTNNSQFSLLIASFNLNSTWTPLVAGIFVARFGTKWSSVLTTACVFIGQLILFVGVKTGHLITMTLGLFIFGLGVTPLAVVQETLVSHLSPGNHLGLALALGLVSGKLSSFLSSLVSLPLADHYGDTIPFGLAMTLCAFSFSMNLVRLYFRWGQSPGKEEAKVKEKRMVSFGGIGLLGDVFWLYIFLNVLSGAIWQPFLHLSASLIQTRYDITASSAAFEASILLAGAIILYPIIGYLTDHFNPHTPRTTFHLTHLSSFLTLLAYSYILLPPSLTQAPWIGMILFATGHGMATLLFVILVPRILPHKMIPLGLGLHKSMEMASSSISQTLAGLWLDRTKGLNDISESYYAGEGSLRVFWLINLGQLGVSFGLWWLEGRRRKDIADGQVLELAGGYERLPLSATRSDLEGSVESERSERRGEIDHSDEEEEELEEEHVELDDQKGIKRDSSVISSALARTDRERRRSRISFWTSIAWIGLVWVVFLCTAWSRL